MKLSKNLSYYEGVKSITADRNNLVNKPRNAALLNMFILANNLFQPIRDHFDSPIYVSSFFRSKQLNIKVGGSKNSDHIKGCAIDLDAEVYEGLTNADIFHFVKDYLRFKKLIYEHGNEKEPAWVHISYQNGYNHIKDVLKAVKIGDETVYLKWQ